MSKPPRDSELLAMAAALANVRGVFDTYDVGVNVGTGPERLTVNGRLWRDIRGLLLDEHPLLTHARLIKRMKPKHANDYPFQCRYEERGDTYDFRLFLSVHHDIAAPYPQRLSGLSLDAPDWLKELVALGKVGGYTVEVKNPPPDRLLWFGLEKDGTLGAFLNFNDV